MPLAASPMPADHELIATLRQAVPAVDALFADARRAVAERVMKDGRAVSRVFDREQRATHGLAWLATYVEALRQLAAYAERLAATDNFGEIEELLVRVGAGEYLAQIFGGIPMSQGEIVRLADLGLPPAAAAARMTPAVEHLIAFGNTAPRRARLVELIRLQHEATIGACGSRRNARFDPRGNAQVRRRRGRAACAANGICATTTSRSTLSRKCPSSACSSLTIPEDYGGMGLGKESMCVVSEELSRGYIGVGSLGTRSEIAAELILGSGTEEQKRKWLPKIASGEVLPTAVFTEPNTGSDLAALKTRAVRDGRCLQGLRQQDLDHASGARRPDDAARAHQSGREGLSRPFHAARGKAARQRQESVSGLRHDREPRSRCSAIAA